jgi:hypothetical protein
MSFTGASFLQVHQLAKLFHLAATHRHLKIQILQPQNIGVVKPWLDLADLMQVDAERTVAAEKMAG